MPRLGQNLGKYLSWHVISTCDEILFFKGTELFEYQLHDITNSALYSVLNIDRICHLFYAEYAQTLQITS